MAKEGSVFMQADRQPASVATCNSVEFSARNAALRSLQPSHRVDYDDSIIGYRSLPAARPPHLTIVARRFTAKAASRLRAVTILIRLPLVYGRPM